MDPTRWKRVEYLFDEAARRVVPERDAFLARECAGDPELLAEVRALLAADTTGHSLLDGHAMDAVEGLGGAQEVFSLVGHDVGPYRVVERIGVGGMGDVYMAERTDGQFDQRVALKVIKRGMDSEEILRRFQSERQILARLEHPNIARLLDGGISDEGVSYFTMEYVDGTPIDQYCDRHQLNIDQRLELFETVCEAVEYAQQNLVVHRDIKPGNILVTADGTVKLLDFGIAKVLGDDDADSGFTRTGAQLMTPRYASPEQVQGEPVTTATDVYALGVILYELLCGARPYAGDTNTPSEISQAIVETSPQRPSERAASRDETGGLLRPGDIARARSTRVDPLRRRLRGDLDNICLYALRKEPERRYSSAEQLLDDIRRHRSGRTVSARSDTVRYRFEKFVVRNRAGVTAGAVVLLTIVAVIGFYTSRLAAQRDRARVEASKAATVSEFLGGLFKVASPSESLGDTVTARELLDRGAQRIDEELASEPALRAQMLTTIGNVYHGLGMYAQAESLVVRGLDLRRELHGDRHREVEESMRVLAHIVFEKGDHDRTYQMNTELLPLQIDLYGEEDTLVALTYNNMGWISYERDQGARSEEYHRKALAMRQRLRGPDHVDVAESFNNLAAALFLQGHNATAESLFTEALRIRESALGDDHSKTNETIANIALLAEARGDYAKAEEYLRRAMRSERRVMGDDHPELATMMVNLARVIRMQYKYDEAEQFLERAIELDLTRGEDHPYVGYDINELAGLLLDKGEVERAIEKYNQAIAQYRKTLADDHGYIVSSRIGLGLALVSAGRHSEAAPLLERQIAALEAAGETGHYRMGNARVALGAAYGHLERFDDANRLLARGYANLLDTLGPDSPHSLRAARWINELYRRWTPPADARIETGESP